MKSFYSFSSQFALDIFPSHLISEGHCHFGWFLSIDVEFLMMVKN